MHRIALLTLLALLAGCGFQLRKELQLPSELSALRLEIADPYSPLGRGLEQSLRRAGALFVETGDAAVLRVPVARVEQVPLAIGASGRVQEYALRYTVEFELIDARGEVVVPRQPVQLERAYEFDTAQAIGSPAEQDIVRSEIERDMVAAVLRRIDAALRG